MVHFEKPIKTKKTSGKKNTIDPVFNESINFNITPQQLENTSMVITVWDYNSKSKDDFVGRIVLGKYGTGPHEYTHWSRMLNSQRSAVAQWHSLRSRQECDQVSPASIAVPWHRLYRHSRMWISNVWLWHEFFHTCQNKRIYSYVVTFVSELIFFISHLLRFFKQLIVNCMTSSPCGLGRANSMCTLPIYGTCIHVKESNNSCMCDVFMWRNMCTCLFMMFFTLFEYMHTCTYYTCTCI